ncbi:MASE1 domain-containing protein [Lentzea sp. NPDC059081]|uniref:MASE1 domain-containing protein n=1 Tax=Lentzea sp. NPDC059081 TaxID=3346719 RepID=UPI0036B89950
MSDGTSVAFRRETSGLAIAAAACLAVLPGLLARHQFYGAVLPLWPSSGIALAAALLWWRAWPLVLLALVTANLALGRPVVLSAAEALTETAGAMLTGFALTRLGLHTSLRRARDAVLLVLPGAVVGTVPAALVGSTAARWLDPAAAASWLSWWVGDVLGVLVFTPLILATCEFVHRHGQRGFRSWIDAVALGAPVDAGTVVVCCAFTAAAVAIGGLPSLLVLLPLNIWAAWRLEYVVTAWCVLLSAVGAIIAHARGTGAFAHLGTTQNLASLGTSGVSLVLTTLLLTVAARERRRALDKAARTGVDLDQRIRLETTELAGAVRRLEQREDLLTRAQEIGHIGSAEIDLVTGAATCSAEMLRLHGLDEWQDGAGHEFLLRQLQPADVEAVLAAHRRALRTHGRADVEHRLDVADGSVRWLHRRIAVVLDTAGDPVRLVETAQDITAARAALRQARNSEQRTQTLLDCVPDAIVGITARGHISLTNAPARELFGYSEQEMQGQPVEFLLPHRLRDRHEEHRDGYLSHSPPVARPMGVGHALVGMRKSGSEFPVDVSLRPLTGSGAELGQAVVVAAIRDVTERKRADDAMRELDQARGHRKQALEINDNIIQGLVASLYTFERDDGAHAIDTVHRTLDAARAMMRNLLSGSSSIEAGDLARQSAAGLPRAAEHPPEHVARTEEADRVDKITVVLADDSPEVRLALRLALDAIDRVIVVGEAGNGLDAIFVTAETSPDLVLLDLAMPTLDGLQALPQIRAACPSAKIVVLSGYGTDQVARQALELGATTYVEKGGSLRNLAGMLRRLFPNTGFSPAPPPADPADEPFRTAAPQRFDRTAGQSEIVTACAHELRNPITAAAGLNQLLAERIGRLPSAAVRELIEAIGRNLGQLDRLVTAMSDAQRASAGNLDLVLERRDMCALTRTVIAELRQLTADNPVTITGPDEVSAAVDPFRYRQMLTNLLSNSVKASPRTAPITITIGERDQMVVVAVADRGAGIDQEQQAALFTKYGRTRRAGHGLGLGLYLSREIARAHGGDIVLDESGPNGSTFSVHLPLVRTALDD